MAIHKTLIQPPQKRERSFTLMLLILFVVMALTPAGEAAAGDAVAELIKKENMGSVEEYAVWLRSNILYLRDRGIDSWTPPAETLERGYGDCEDYAFLNQAVLNHLGYEPAVLALTVRINGGDHAICVFKKDGRYGWFDNASLNMTEAHSETQLRALLTLRYYCGKIVKLKNTSQDASITAAPEGRSR